MSSNGARLVALALLAGCGGNAGNRDAAAETAPRLNFATGVAVGDYHACAILDQQRVKCWGRANAANGKMITPVMEERDTQVGVRTIAAGGPQTCVILNDGNVHCWAPASDASRTVSRFIDLGARRAVAIGVTNEEACAAQDDGSVRCWNDGWFTPPIPAIFETAIPPARGASSEIAQLGFGFANTVSALYKDGTVSEPMGLALAPPRLIDGRVALAIGASRSITSWCVGFQAGGVTCTGLSADDLAVADVQLISIVRGTAFMCGLRPNGLVSCWGKIPGCEDDSAEATYWCQRGGNPDGSHDVQIAGAVALAISSTHVPIVCAVLDNGTIKCWGGTPAECTGADGARACRPPAQQDELLADSVEIVETPEGRRYGTWHPIDFSR